MIDRGLKDGVYASRFHWLEFSLLHFLLLIISNHFALPTICVTLALKLYTIIFLGRIFEIILFKINLHELSFSLLVASMGETMAKSDKNLVQKYLELDQCGRYRKSKAMNMQLQILFFFWQGPSIVYLD